MKASLTRVKQSVTLTATCALLAACAVGNQAPQQVSTQTAFTGEKRATPLKAERAKATELGLAPADLKVAENQFQLKSATGEPVAKATVWINGASFETDAQGVLTLSPELLASSEPLMAAVEAEGFVGTSFTMMPGYAFKLTPKDDAKTLITAGGGIARNAGGTLEVQFPPGALTKDADVVVTRVYSDKVVPGTPIPQVAFTDVLEPGNEVEVDVSELPVLGQFQYFIDLGGAELTPGSTYTVRFKAQGPMLEMLKMREARGDTFEHSVDQVTKDANGDFWLAMQVQGPAAESAEPTGKYGLLAASCRELYGETVADVEANNRQATVCPGAGSPDWWANNKPNASVAGIMTHDSRFNGGGCVYFQYDPNLYVCRTANYQGGWWGDRRDKIMRRWWSTSINARVTWASDDSRLAGKVPAGARVRFSHALTPIHNAPLNVPVPADGVASTTGQKGSSGNANAYIPNQSWPSSTAYYNVDCRTVGITLSRYLPQVTLNFNVAGAATTQSLTVPTSLGDYAVSTLSSPVIKPALSLDANAQQLSISSSLQLEPSTWLDLVSNPVTAAWNGRVTLPVDAYFSKQIGARLAYASNDASVPEDQRPSTQWNGQAVTNGTISFGHPVSRASSKPASRDELSFRNVTSATTWGLHQSDGTASGSRTFANGIALTGSAPYKVQGQTIDVGVGANLPAVKFRIAGEYKDGYTVDYRLVRDDGQTQVKRARLQPPQGGVYTLNLPVEEAVNDAHKHRFELVSITNGDWAATTLDSSRNFPAVGDLHRGKQAVTYPVDLQFEAFAAK